MSKAQNAAIDKMTNLSNGMKVYLKMNSISQIMKDKGLVASGDVQAFHTQNVLRRIQKYMPYRTGATIKLTIAQTDIHKPEIVTDTPYAKFLFYGKLMVDPKTDAAGFMTKNGWRSRKGVPKVRSGRDITYTKTKHTKAGPFWDRALSAAEGKAMAADLQRYIDRKR